MAEVNRRPPVMYGAAEYDSVRGERDELKAENERLRQAVRNQCADNMCWFSDPAIGKILPESEMLESCRRYIRQIASTDGTVTNALTIAQLEAKVQDLTDERDTLRASHDGLRQAVARLEANAQSSRCTIEELTSRLRSVREQRNENLRIAQKYQGQVFRLHSVHRERDEALAKVQSLEETLRVRDGEIQSLEVLRDSLRNECERQTGERVKAGKELVEAQGKLQARTAELKEHAEKLSEAADYITHLEGIGESKSQFLVAAQRLCTVAQDQRDQLMNECNNKIFADVQGMEIAEPNPAIIAEIIKFFNACSLRKAGDVAPGLYRNFPKWIEELNYLPRRRPGQHRSYAPGELADQQSEVAELRKRRDELFEANNREVERRRAAERDLMCAADVYERTIAELDGQRKSAEVHVQQLSENNSGLEKALATARNSISQLCKKNAKVESVLRDALEKIAAE